MALKLKSNNLFIFLLFIYIKQNDGKRVCFFVFPPPNVIYFVNIELGLSQKTFLRSRQEMPSYLKHSKNQELRQKLIELLLERLLMLTLRSTTTSTKLLMPPLSNPREMLRSTDHSSSKTHQRLLLSSE